MSSFDVILFDVGGVLLSNGWDSKERASAVEHFKLDAHAFETRHEDLAPVWEREEIDLDKYLNVAIFYEPRQFSRDEFFDFMRVQSYLLPQGAMGILKELATSRRYLVGALNNEARETNEFRFDKFDLRCYFKVTLSSCYVGLRKPDPAMYQRALDILGAPPRAYSLSTIGKRMLWAEQRLG